MKKYAALNQQFFDSNGYSIVPLRFEDRHQIRKWRNEQIYHLRQNKALSESDQDWYFNHVVSKLFEEKNPKQILFSYIKDEECIGYGGLVHINWTDRNAEISFLMDTSLEKKYFEFHWTNFLSLIEKVAFKELNFHKIYTYAFDIRPKLYLALENRNFKKEAVLKEHSLFNGKFVDVMIHSKIHQDLLLREAKIKDLEITYKWANDKTVRKFAYSQNQISFQEHSDWFKSKIESQKCKYFILEEKNKRPAGSIRFDLDLKQKSAKISYLVDPECTGKGYGTYILKKGIENLLNLNLDIKNICGFVFTKNIPSIQIFKKLDFKITSENKTEIKFEKKLK